MTTESELRNFIKLEEEHLEEAKNNLHKLLAKPKIQVYQNMPVIVNAMERYASSRLINGDLAYYQYGCTSYTNESEVLTTENWQPDYDRRSLLNWRPVDETIPEHGDWLVKYKKPAKTVACNKDELIYSFSGWKCIPLYEETE